MLSHLLSEIFSLAGSEPKTGSGTLATAAVAEVEGARFAEFLQGEVAPEKLEPGLVSDISIDANPRMEHVRFPTALNEQPNDNTATAAPAEPVYPEAKLDDVPWPADRPLASFPAADPALVKQSALVTFTGASGDTPPIGDDNTPVAVPDEGVLRTPFRGAENSHPQEPRSEPAAIHVTRQQPKQAEPGASGTALPGDVPDATGLPSLPPQAEPAESAAQVGAVQTRTDPAGVPASPAVTSGSERNPAPLNKKTIVAPTPVDTPTNEPAAVVRPETHLRDPAASDNNTGRSVLVQDGLNPGLHTPRSAFAIPPASDFRDATGQFTRIAAAQHDAGPVPGEKPAQQQANVISRENAAPPDKHSQVVRDAKAISQGQSAMEGAPTVPRPLANRVTNAVFAIDPKLGGAVPGQEPTLPQPSMRDPEKANVRSSIPKDVLPLAPSRPLAETPLNERRAVVAGFASIQAKVQPAAEIGAGMPPEDAAPSYEAGARMQDVHPRTGQMSPAPPVGNSPYAGAQDGAVAISAAPDSVADYAKSEPDFVTFRPIESPVVAPEAAANRPDLARHVARQLAEIPVRMPDRPVELTLNPEELGRVRLIFTTTDAGLTVALSTERPETMEFMRRHIETLAREFHDIGYRSVNFEFGGGANRDPNTAPEGGPPGRDPQVAADDEAPQTPIKLSLDLTQGLDLRL